MLLISFRIPFAWMVVALASTFILYAVSLSLSSMICDDNFWLYRLLRSRNVNTTVNKQFRKVSKLIWLFVKKWRHRRPKKRRLKRECNGWKEFYILQIALQKRLCNNSWHWNNNFHCLSFTFVWIFVCVCAFAHSTSFLCPPLSPKRRYLLLGAFGLVFGYHQKFAGPNCGCKW